MRTTVYFVRHAEAQSNVSQSFEGEDNLTNIGISQSQAIANRFKNISIDKIYVSDILRAQQTAQEITKMTGASMETKGFLKEGKDGEDFTILKSRLFESKLLLENSEHKHIVVVSHAIFLKSLISYILLGELLTDESLTIMADVLVVENGSLSMFVFNNEKKKWRIMSLNDKVHLVD